jgi:hypothetical protein
MPTIRTGHGSSPRQQGERPQVAETAARRTVCRIQRGRQEAREKVSPVFRGHLGLADRPLQVRYHHRQVALLRCVTFYLDCLTGDLDESGETEHETKHLQAAKRASTTPGPRLSKRSSRRVARWPRRARCIRPRSAACREKEEVGESVSTFRKSRPVCMYVVDVAVLTG